MKNEQNYRQRSLKRYDVYKKLVPPGIEISTQIRNYLIWLFVVVLLSVNEFIVTYNEAYADLYYWNRENGRSLRTGAVMQDFCKILDGSLTGFFLLGLFMVAVVVWYYTYYYRESKSIYLMKRLPSRWEIHKRSLTFPFMAIVITLISAFLMMMVYYAIYMLVTPQQCIAPGQWQKIWM